MPNGGISAIDNIEFVKNREAKVEIPAKVSEVQNAPRLQSLPHNGTTFHGRLSYKALEAELREQHVAVNAIRAKAPQSVTNKLCDYLGLGCPLLNSQEGEEVKGLLSKRLHRNYRAGDISSASKAIAEMIESPRTREVWKADPTFSRNAISDAIIDFIETL